MHLLKLNRISLALVLAFSFPVAAHGAVAKKALAKEPALYVERNWGLNNTDSPSHINAKAAWAAVKPSHEVIVAVIDTGVDPQHPLLKNNLWKDPASGATGYDFVLNKKAISDDNGHGTHVSGIILATTGVTKGKSKVKIMPLRYYSDASSGADQLDFTVKAIDYAVSKGAKVINYSAEGMGFSRAEFQAIERAKAKGVVFICAAGNRGRDNDAVSNPSYPASYDLPNIITVAATNQQNELIPSSNWGSKHVHVAAPGENILSSLPGGNWGYVSGTSQATAFVTGLAAMLLSENPKLKPEEIRAILEKSSDPELALSSKVAAAGRVNALAALNLARSGSRTLSSSETLRLVK